MRWEVMSDIGSTSWIGSSNDGEGVEAELWAEEPVIDANKDEKKPELADGLEGTSASFGGCFFSDPMLYTSLSVLTVIFIAKDFQKKVCWEKRKDLTSRFYRNHVHCTTFTFPLEMFGEEDFLWNTHFLGYCSKLICIKPKGNILKVNHKRDT